MNVLILQWYNVLDFFFCLSSRSGTVKNKNIWIFHFGVYSGRTFNLVGTLEYLWVPKGLIFTNMLQILLSYKFIIKRFYIAPISKILKFNKRFSISFSTLIKKKVYRSFKLIVYEYLKLDITFTRKLTNSRRYSYFVVIQKPITNK